MMHNLPLSHLHIGVAGFGLLGRLVSWRLLLLGARVRVFEARSRSGIQAAGFTAAGMIAPLSEAAVSGRDVYQMGCHALDTWPAWLKDITCADAGKLFATNGSLVVAHPQDHAELIQLRQTLRHILGDNLSGEHLDAKGIQALEPDLNPAFAKGLLLAPEASIDNRGFFALVEQEIAALGGEIVEHTPVQISPNTVSFSDGQTQSFDWVIDCRGFGSKPQQSGLRGVRGETLHVYTPEINLSRPVRLMHPRYQLYVVPKPDQRFVIGATQIESEDTSPVSLQSSLELSSALYTLAPAFAEARILALETNLRPAYIDNQPRLEINPGLIRANGLFRHGYLLAPAMVDTLLQRLTNPLAADPFTLIKDNKAA